MSPLNICHGTPQKRYVFDVSPSWLNFISMRFVSSSKPASLMAVELRRIVFIIILNSKLLYLNFCGGLGF